MKEYMDLKDEVSHLRSALTAATKLQKETEIKYNELKNQKGGGYHTIHVDGPQGKAPLAPCEKCKKMYLVYWGAKV
jgi:hypothetical protein